MRGGQSLRIIHLSDLHFGKKHRFGGETTATGDYVAGAGYPTLAESIRADLANVDHEIPQIVCLTGDFTETALPAQFREAQRFYQALCDGADRIGPGAVVPGNHDVDWTQDRREDRMDSWRVFFGDIRGNYASWASAQRDTLVRTDLVESHGVIIAEINSCGWVKQLTEESHRGRVDPFALKHSETQLEALDAHVVRSCIKVALVHHHPILIPDLAEPGRGYDAIHGAGHLLTILRRYGFHLLLHGHKHNPFTFTEDSLSAQQTERHDYPLFVVCGGSVASTELPDDRSPVNCYNRIEIKWLPDANQYRCRVETRALVRTTPGGAMQLPIDWTWRELSRDDRSFRPERSISGSDRQLWRSWGDHDVDTPRIEQYQRTRGVFPTVAVRPSLTPGQAHEALIELRNHPTPNDVERIDIESVRWAAGQRHGVYELQKDKGPRFRAAFDYYGPMLIQGSVTWVDGHKADLFIYAQREAIEQ